MKPDLRADRERRLSVMPRHPQSSGHYPLLALLAISLLLPAAAPAAPIVDLDCLACHGDRSLTRSTPGAQASLFADTTALHASVHAGLGCVSCHAGVTTIPHPGVLARVRCASCHAGVADSLARSVHAGGGRAGPGCTGCHGTHAIRPSARLGMSACGDCHARVSDEYQGSVHGMALAHGDPEASTCRDCHGPVHSIRSHRDSTAPTSRARLAETCARCHADRELMTRRKITIPEAYTLYRASVHGRSRDPKAASCNDCHESHRLLPASDPASSINRGHIAETCGRCHAQEARDYRLSIHATALARGVSASPACIDCHGEHRVRGPREPGSPVAAAGVSATCARCHEAEGIRETYGLPAGRLSTYRDSYHGLAARGGSPVVANCASCHGTHAILPSSDPRSDINLRNLPRTCGKCHPGAGERFASGAVHVAMARPDHPVLFWARRIYLWLIALTIGGMLVHNGLDYLSRLREHFRVQGSGSARAERAGEGPGAGAPKAARAARWILRLTVSERIQHAVLLVSFFTLVYTGFALKFPEAAGFAWLARLERGYAWRSLIHRGAALVMIGSALFHVVTLFGPRGRGWLRDMRPRGRDARDAVANLLFFVGLRREAPAFDRFGYVEKAEYWAVAWGTGIMTVTGLALWFENQSLRWLQKWMLDLATLVHYYEAWLAFLAILVWHLYHTVLSPAVYPMNRSWITGRISEEELRRDHAAEWARLEAAEEEQEPGTGSPGG